MSRNNQNKNKQSFKEQFMAGLELANKNKGEKHTKHTKKEIVGSIMSVIGVVTFAASVVCGFLTRFGNKSMHDVALVITIVCFAISIVLMIVGTAIAKGKKGFRSVGNGSSEKDIGSADSYVKNVDEEKVSQKEKENIELISQYERLYEQGLISKEELERRKNNVLK